MFSFDWRSRGVGLLQRPMSPTDAVISRAEVYKDLGSIGRKRMETMIIVLEGLEGTGKTSLATILCERHGCKYVKTPPVEFTPLRSFVATQDNPNMEFYFYLSGVFAVQDIIRPFKGSPRHAVVDRYIHTPIAYHARGRTFAYPAFAERRLLRADVTIHVTCSTDARSRRKMERGFHLFERATSDDQKIEKYFRTVCDMEFDNDSVLDVASSELWKLIGTRFEDKSAKP